MRKILLFLIFLIQSLMGQQIPHIKVPYIKGNVKIDGILEEDCWKNAGKITDFIITWAGGRKEELGKKSKNKTIGYIFYDEDYLYIGVECYDEDTNSIKTGKMKERDKGWGDDCIEIFIDPGLSKEKCFQIIVNPKGIIYDQKFERGKNIVDWDSGFEYEIKIYKEKWVVEVKIPLAELELKENTKTDWGFNITRFEPREWIVQSWAPVFGGNLQPEKFGIIKDIKIDYSRYKFGVDLISWGKLFLGEDFIEFIIENFSDDKTPLICEVYLNDKIQSKKEVILNPKETKKISLNYSVNKKDKKICLFIKDRNEKPIYIGTKYFKIPDKFINLKLDVPIYYLSEKKLVASLEVNIGRLSLKKCEIIFDIIDSKGNTLLTDRIIGINENFVKIPLEIKNLPSGKFNLKCTLKLNGKLVEEKRINFERIKGPFD